MSGGGVWRVMQGEEVARPFAWRVGGYFVFRGNCRDQFQFRVRSGASLKVYVATWPGERQKVVYQKG